MARKREFDIFYNTLSLGWHLRNVMLADPELMKDPEAWQEFVQWLERHKVKQQQPAFVTVA